MFKVSWIFWYLHWSIALNWMKLNMLQFSCIIFSSIIFFVQVFSQYKWHCQKRYDLCGYTFKMRLNNCFNCTEWIKYEKSTQKQSNTYLISYVEWICGKWSNSFVCTEYKVHIINRSAICDCNLITRNSKNIANIVFLYVYMCVLIVALLKWQTFCYLTIVKLDRDVHEGRKKRKNWL